MTTNPYLSLKTKPIVVVPIGVESVSIEQVEDGEAFEDYGVYFVDDRTLARRILVNAKLGGQARDGVVVHELLHAVSDIYGLGLTEKTVRVVEQGLGQALTRWWARA